MFFIARQKAMSPVMDFGKTSPLIRRAKASPVSE
jgi:hypothetical protein